MNGSRATNHLVVAVLASGLIKRLGGRSNPVVWLYHPGLLPLVAGLPRRALVYDVMDRFDAFQKLSAAGQDQESRVLQDADAVFTGGLSLQRSVEEKLAIIGHRAAAPVCLPSGIDLPHFSSVADDGPIANDLQKLPRPIFGYTGALDERIDYSLIVQLAQAGGSVVLVGPQVTPAPELPANVHLLGARPYIELPMYLRGCDVCLLPFRETALVAHISPTKTPEYLAAGKPVVSTMIPDVAATYADVVSISTGPEQFIVECKEAALHPPDVARQQSAAKRAQTWQEIAEQMHVVLQSRLQ